MARTSCDSAYHCRDGYPCQSCRSVLECPASKMCHLSTKDQYVCQSHHRIAEAMRGVLGGAQFSSGPFYHPRSSSGRFGHPREAAVGAGDFPDSNGISDDFKRQKRSHHTEPVPCPYNGYKSFYGTNSSIRKPPSKTRVVRLDYRGRRQKLLLLPSVHLW